MKIFLIGSIRLSSLNLKRVNLIQLSDEMYDFYFHFDLTSSSSNLLFYVKTKDPIHQKFNQNISHSFMLQPLCLNCGFKLRRVLIGISREAVTVNVYNVFPIELINSYIFQYLYRRQIIYCLLKWWLASRWYNEHCRMYSAPHSWIT